MNSNYKNIKILNLLSFIGFWIVTFLFLTGRTVSFDNAIYDAISPIISDTLTSILIFITNLGSTEAIIIICFMLIGMPKTRKPFGIPVTAAVVVSSLANTLIKTIVARPRPDILRLVDASGFSFPSGHSMNNMALYTMIVLILLVYYKDDFKKQLKSLLIFIIPLTIGFSRIYLGVHYPSDVLAGLLAGFWVGSFVFLIYEKYAPQSLK